ncbi:hypothetical protein Barb4_04867 [Bacteroidales bacterium Barb4]|nr:hypothetical protein Barb4_04867 [Bacteroidales bacterium Barb4]
MEATVVSRKKFKGNKQAVSSPAKTKAVKDEWDYIYTKEEFDAMLAESMAQIEAGLGRVMTTERLKELLGL